MAIITGTNASNVINGTSSGDIIAAGNGDDQVNGGAGSDLIDGGNGNDTINGGAGIDLIDGGNGDDNLDGGSGSDLVLGGNGNDVLVYRSGENVGSFDIYDGGNGRDTLRLIIDPALANSAAFQADIAALQAQLNHGSATYVFHSIGLAVTSIERLEVQVTQPTNHPAVIGDPPVHDVTEDVAVNGSGNLTAVGTISITDPDAGQAAFQTTVAGAAGNLGSLQLAANGQYTYSVANSAVQFLGNGDTKVDTFTVTSVDGTTKQVTFTIHGQTEVIVGTPNDDSLTGTPYADIIQGLGGNDAITGLAGDDQIDGGNGVDLAIYSNATGPISVDLAAGTVQGDASVGHDTLISIERVRGTNSADTYSAAGYSGGGLPIGTPVVFNEFEGLGGDDQITGNGNTRVSYANAAAAVTADIAAGTGHGTLAGDAAGVGNDTFTGVNALRGSNFDDTLLGSNNGNNIVEIFEGRAGNDTIDGRGGLDRVAYDNDPTAAGINAVLAAGTVDGDTAIGHDTLHSIEFVRGTNFADSYSAAGFTADTATTPSANAGSQGNFNEFEGLGGNDSITGNGNTRVSYSRALAAVTVDLAAGTAQGTAAGDAANVGTDSLVNVNQVLGSSFDDILLGSNNPTGTSEIFDGSGGNDTIDGRLGFDLARYDIGVPGTSFTSVGISVDMANGIVTGRDATATAIMGVDTLRNVESVRGTNSDDVYNAAGLTTASLNAGNVGQNQANQTLNEFEGMDGDDTITGNGNTRISYVNATAGVTVNLATGTAFGTDAGDLANVGSDIITGGVNGVRGSQFDDLITGTSGNDNFDGQGGNDTIDGGAGQDIAIYSGNLSQYTFSSGPGGALIVAGPDGTDTLTNIELLQFNDAYRVPSTSNISQLGLQAGKPIIGGGLDNTLTVSPNQTNGRLIDLDGGNDVLNLSVGGTYNLNIQNIETVNGSGGNDVVNLQNPFNGSIDLGAGIDALNLSNAGNTLSVNHIENVNGGSGNDIVTLTGASTGVTFRLGAGFDTVNLTAGPNDVTVNSVETVNGSAGDDHVTVQADPSVSFVNETFNGGGGNDTLTLNVFGTPTLNLTLTGVETVNSTGGIETVNLANTPNGLTVDLGGGFDILNLNNGNNIVTANNVETVNAGAGDDTVTVSPDPVIVGLNVNLGGGANVLNLAGTNTTYSLNLSGGGTTVNGAATDDDVTMTSVQVGNSFDLAGGNDTLRLASDAIHVNDITVKNVETVIATNDSDHIAIANTTGITTVTGFLGSDFLTASAGEDHFRYTNYAESPSNSVTRDQITNFDANQDKFVFDGIGGMTTPVHYIDTAAFSGGSNAEARMENIGGQNILQVDGNGDGLGDMWIQLVNLQNGSLHDSNFLVV